ncbi:MAG TPA: hypothetical protein VMV42_00800, partial [archaeon]|nr:hypothetical protein [archaeon]
MGSLTFAPGELSTAVASNSATSVSSTPLAIDSNAYFLLAAVLNSTDPNPGLPITLALATGKNSGVLLYLK